MRTFLIIAAWLCGGALVIYVGCDNTRDVKSEAPKPTGLMYVTVDAPCAKDRDSNVSLAQAIRDSDQAALDGLLARGKVLSLTKGTRFDVSTNDDVAWGFIRSGRNTGETCYIFSAVLSEVPVAP